MAYHFHLVAEKRQRLEEAVDFCIKGHCGVEVPYIIETVCGVEHFGRCVRIPLATHLCGIHAVGEIDGWREIEIFEEVERSAYRDAVAHAVAPVFHEAFLEELVLFRCQ